MGADTFYDRCYSNEDLRPKFDDGTFDYVFIEKVIKTYRTKYSKIPEYWNLLEKSWRWTTKYHEKIVLRKQNLEFFWEDGATFIRLPSGRLQRYPHASANGRTLTSKTGGLRYHWGKLWGGTLTENVISALCRDLIAESILRLLKNGFWVVLTVHDEIVCLLEEKNAGSRLKEMGEIMCELPAWATDFPLSVEGCLTECYKK
jgi:DNA polymerase